jgi:RND family efflux transporter MFP subunit
LKWIRVIPLFIGLLGGGFIGYRMKKSTPVQERRILYYRDPMHPAYRSNKPGVAPDCGMQLEPVYADGLAASLMPGPDADFGGAVIAPATQRLYGIRVVPVLSGAQQSRMRLFGRVEPDETRVYSIEFGTDGYVKATHSDSVGNHVTKNQKLATVYSPEFLTVAGGYLAANERFPNSANAAKDVPLTASQNSASVAARADRLRNLGVSDFQIEEMTQGSKLPEDVYLVSPTDGFILSRNISPGMRFERHTQLYTIADLSHVWIMADAFGRDSQLVHVGMKARITVPETELSATAVITDVLPAVDPVTQSLSIRLECDNPGFRFRRGMFVNVDVAVELPPGLTVPADAIVDTGTSRRLYVRADDSHFVPRVVQTGWQIGDRVQVLGGLHDGESVVSDGTFLVDSEARLRAPGQPAGGAGGVK